MPPKETASSSGEHTIRQSASRAQRLLGHLGIGNKTPTAGAEHYTNPFETGNFVKLAPALSKASHTASERTHQFQYIAADSHISSDNIGQNAIEHPDLQTTHEGEAIASFMNFLDAADTLADQVTAEPEALKMFLDLTGDEKILFGYDGMDRPVTEQEDLSAWLHRKMSALRYTTFLGDAELQEATAGLAEYWKSYLAEDVGRQICLPGVSTKHTGKSSNFVVEQIFSRFTPEEQQRFKGQILTDMDRLTAPPDKTKIILVDDWIMSGDQMQEHEARVMRYEYKDGPDGEFESIPGPYNDSVEINLLVGDEARLQRGFTYHQGVGLERPALPVKAYFKALYAQDGADNDPDARYHGRITGIHSSTDGHFSITIHNIVALLREFCPDKAGVEALGTPPLTNIVRTYRKLDPVNTRAAITEPPADWIPPRKGIFG